MNETIVIPRRFNGPPDYGHGGYSCGVVAVEVDARVASVSLRRPPPLDTAMELRRSEDGTVAALHDGDVVAEGARAELSLDVPEPVSVEEARVARSRNEWTDRHPFPTCFGCGTQRDRAEAIATIMGPVEGRTGLVADTWVPQTEFADADGHVQPLFVWAALDCPTGGAAIAPGDGPHVLARLTADPAIAPVRAGEEHIVMAWPTRRQGRKTWGAAALLSADGQVCAVGEGLWLALRDPSTHGARV